MTKSIDSISGNIVDPLRRTITPGTLKIANGRIIEIIEDDNNYDTYLIPGFVDAHVHIESSMLVPSEFARLAVIHGTVATVSDPHEIGNVLGLAGVEYMIENGKTSPLKFNFGAPSCVPATYFETAGAEIGLEDIKTLLARDEVKYLSEMMNFPGVLYGDKLVAAKMQVAESAGKPIDGHAPGLRGTDAAQYFCAGISTDHECFTIEEALDKLKFEAKILIREGSAAKNFEALYPLIANYSDRCMFCTDDMHPNELEHGHIDRLVRRAVEHGLDPLDVLKCACVNPVSHYGLDVGLLRVGDPADFVEIDNLTDFGVLRTVINGKLVAEQGQTLIPRSEASIINRFETSLKRPTDFAVAPKGDTIKVIEAIEGQLITHKLTSQALVQNNNVTSDVTQDVLKIAVVNRYKDASPAIGFIKNFGLTRGALASSVAHDSHNIIAVGVTDEDLCRAVNLLIDHRGGLSVVSNDTETVLPLPVAGIMTNEDGFTVAQQYAAIDQKAKNLGTTLTAPYMTLSFMALLVIPSLKMSDLGLFDGTQFALTDLFE